MADVVRRRYWLILVALVVCGLLWRLYAVLESPGSFFDLHNYDLMRATLTGDDPLSFYETVNARFLADDAPIPRWPYSLALFPVTAIMEWVADAADLATGRIYRLPPIAADLAVAFVVQEALRRRGASHGRRLLAFALVAVGPSFVANSAYHGQFDSLAILAPLLAVLIWEERSGRRDVILAGALVGLGGALKTVPILAVLALLPTASSWRERRDVLVAAAVPPLLVLLPFVLRDPSSVVRSLAYGGYPGRGGLSLLLQPNLGRGADPNEVTELVQDLSRPVVIVVLLVLTVVLVRKRVAAPTAAAMIFLAVLVFGVNFAYGYVLWVVPFLLVDDRIAAAAAIQLALLPANALVYEASSTSATLYWWIYLPSVAATWAVIAVLLARDTIGVVGDRAP
ncbi:MAG: glycosyltransferase 87 family protein [Actinomycetota bacterium]